MSAYKSISEEKFISMMGEAIRKEREELGLTQKRFAENAGMSPSYLSQVEHGHRPLSISMFLQICNGNSISPFTLLKELYPERSVYDLVVDKAPMLDQRELDKILDFLNSIRAIPRD